MRDNFTTLKTTLPVFKISFPVLENNYGRFSRVNKTKEKAHTERNERRQEERVKGL